MTDNQRRPLWRRIMPMILLFLGAIVFLFPFYYMIVGALQTKRDPTLLGAFPWPSNFTFNNFIDINEAINLGRALTNSGIFTGAVVVCTLFFGIMAGYALATLEFRGRGLLFAVVLLLQTVPFQLLMVPLYVLLVRGFGLGDTYVGMILPFAINSVAVLIFRQFFLQVPRELFDAARIDGAGEFRILRSIAVPLVRPAILTAALVTFIGPWNEFLWPFLITKEASLQPLAVAIANFTSTGAGYHTNAIGSILAGSTVLAVPAVVLFIVFQRHFTATDASTGTKG
ncbi:carbohydrate ABC transporter permease [Pengzhenrongella sp.]|jgi:multiple sugar transport system permease protein|uniref:carbohydrate ABC transporter permease n=1 Tax=Pengzhenrongella sp. TaxID=2888820 RepID=UPI002F935FBA